ncbi:ras-related protein rab-13 [Anaeramoeba ignava]|uniref:Ras-related protein rab-13 n=1 Tax=Anaeramoeba ignava TaxID=1746090 RepID=A0A9Q0RDD2_ANAIG|nr:ras-related protein rab-13 [Anaeramoeba ignava]
MISKPHIKIFVIGNNFVGKTCLIERIYTGIFNDTGIFESNSPSQKKYFQFKNEDYQIDFLDHPGNLSFEDHIKNHRRIIDGIFICYDITDENSFRSLLELLENKKSLPKKAIKYLIGTKCELENQRQISKQRAQDFADQFGLKFYEVSSKENINIDESFTEMANDIISNIYSFENIEIVERLYDVGSIIEDLRKFYERKEFCDDEIECYDENNQKIKIPIHKFIIQNRLHINDNIFQKKIKPLLSKKSQKKIDILLEWIYFGRIEINSNYSIFKNLKEKLSKVCETTFRIGTEGLINDFKKIMNDEESKDFEIILNKERIKVHKIMLIIRSELYRGMFLAVNEDKSNSVYDYSHFKTETIRAMIYFFYTDDIPKDLRNLIYDELSQCVDYFHLNPKLLTTLKLIPKKKEDKNEKKCKIL